MIFHAIRQGRQFFLEQKLAARANAARERTGLAAFELKIVPPCADTGSCSL